MVGPLRRRQARGRLLLSLAVVRAELLVQQRPALLRLHELQMSRKERVRLRYVADVFVWLLHDRGGRHARLHRRKGGVVTCAREGTVDRLLGAQIVVGLSYTGVAVRGLHEPVPARRRRLLGSLGQRQMHLALVWGLPLRLRGRLRGVVHRVLLDARAVTGHHAVRLAMLPLRRSQVAVNGLVRRYQGPEGVLLLGGTILVELDDVLHFLAGLVEQVLADGLQVVAELGVEAPLVGVTHLLEGVALELLPGWSVQVCDLPLSARVGGGLLERVHVGSR